MNKSNDTRYWIRAVGMPWQEATIDQFIRAERAANFYPKSGEGIATGGFSGANIDGKVTEGEITVEKYNDDPEFLKVALGNLAFQAESNEKVVMIKCPGCELQLPDNNVSGQIKHMEDAHPEIIAQRHRNAGIRSKYTEVV